MSATAGEDKIQDKMAEMSITTEQQQQERGAAKSTFKRDSLRQNEIQVQKMWDDVHAFDADPMMNDKETFMVTFPYPYSNGHLHIGHAYSLTKAIFRAQYERHLQKNVLFPFAFHCTGMPIQAVCK